MGGRNSGRRRLLAEDKRRVMRLIAAGADYETVRAEIGVSLRVISRIVHEAGGIPPRPETLSGSRLSRADREEIRAGLVGKDTLAVIAARIGFAESTVSREISRNGGRRDYQAWRAHADTSDRMARPKKAKLAVNKRLCAHVEQRLGEQFWSPRQISVRLRIEFPDDPMMRVSHETIYQSLYVQGRGALRKELAACLRTGRAIRKPHDQAEKRGKIAGMIPISERPAEADDRAVVGHWEGDLIIGKNNKSAVGTLVERSTRFVLLLHLPDGYSAVEVREAMITAIKTLPTVLHPKTITWDQGKEMSEHAKFTIDAGIDVYFCDPHSPWQRGSNENTNGLLRQFMPKSTDLTQHSPEDLAHYADLLNGRPRQTLNWMTPYEKLNELILASTP
jgi:transposase, IS30 family